MKTFTIPHKEVPKGIRFLVLGLAIVFALLPLVVIGNWLYFFHIALLFFLGIFWAGAFFLFRSYLWNTYGCEILQITDSELIYLADYKYYQDGRTSLSLTDLKIEIVDEDKVNQTGRLGFTHPLQDFDSVLRADTTLLMEIVQAVELARETQS